MKILSWCKKRTTAKKTNSRQKILVHCNLHGPNGTDGNTESTGRTFIRGEVNCHGWTINKEGVGGTEAGTGATLNAQIVIAADNGGDRLDLNAIILKKFEGFLHVVFMTCKLKNHHPVVTREDSSLENIKLNVVLLYKFTDDRFITGLLGKMKDIYFSAHNLYKEERVKGCLKRRYKIAEHIEAYFNERNITDEN